MRYLVGIFRLFVLGLFLIVLLGLVYFCYPFLDIRKRGRLSQKLAGMLAAIVGVKINRRGDENCDPNAAYMLCSNHISFVDIFTLFTVLPTRFVAKKEIASWPLIGAITKAGETIFIDRSRKRAVLEINEAMAESLKAGRSVLFFPEGTTSYGTELLPFHANLFEAAVVSGVPVLPVTLRYLHNGRPTTLTSYAGKTPLITVLRRIIFTQGLSVEMTILPPVSSEGKTRNDLCLELSAVMARQLALPDATAAKETARRERLRAAENAAVI